MVLLFKAQRLKPRPMRRVGNACRWFIEKTNLPAGHPARSWTALKATLCVFCLTQERHGEGGLALLAITHPARCGVRHPSRLGPITNAPRGGPRRSLCQESQQLQQIKLRFKAIPVMHQWMAEPSELDVGSRMPGGEALGSDLSC